MADVETVELLAWMDTLPAPTNDSCWDTIFLMPLADRDYGVMMAWFWYNCINPEGRRALDQG